MCGGDIMLMPGPFRRPGGGPVKQAEYVRPKRAGRARSA